MNVIGLPRARCSEALDGYVLRLKEVAELMAANDGTNQAAWARLEDLRFQLEVDVRARATVAGRARMTTVEATAFEPALRATWERVAKIGTHGDVGPSTTEALREIASRLAAWRDCIATCATGGRADCAQRC